MICSARGVSGKISSIILVLWVALFVAVTFGAWNVLLTYGQKENLSGLLTAEFYTKIGFGDWTVSEIGGYPAQAIVKWANSNGLAQQLQQNLNRSLLAGLAGSTGGLLICIFLWRRSGRRLTEDTLLRGTEVREASEVIKKSKNDRALDLSIGGVHLQGNRYGWPGHILFCGSPRTGKTVAIEGLLQTIRENHPDHSVVLYDRKGSYVEKWYDKTLDVIANPLDSRMQDAGGWDLWEEVREPLHIEELATAFLPMRRS